MKKILCLLLVLVFSVSVLVACKNNAKETKTTENSTTVTADNNDNNASEDSPVKEDEKNDTVSKNESGSTEEPEKFELKNDSDAEYFIITNGTNDENILYHTKNCPLLKGNETQSTSWEMIKMLEFRHCAKCNPPKYEGYVE